MGCRPKLECIGNDGLVATSCRALQRTRRSAVAEKVPTDRKVQFDRVSAEHPLYTSGPCVRYRAAQGPMTKAGIRFPAGKGLTVDPQGPPTRGTGVRVKIRFTKPTLQRPAPGRVGRVHLSSSADGGHRAPVGKGVRLPNTGHADDFTGRDAAPARGFATGLGARSRDARPS